MILRATQFYFKMGLFSTKELLSDLASGAAGFLLFPFYVWLIARMWSHFNSYQGNYAFGDILLYVGISQILFITFLRPNWFARASGDFSISLARPRSWLMINFSWIFGRCLSSRLIYLCVFLAIMPLFGIGIERVCLVALRLFFLLPILGVFQALVGLMFASSQVRWAETSYFVLPASKVFLVLGGVYCPLIDFGEPWRTRLLSLPISDVFFQPAHFCIEGAFYQITAFQWTLKVLILCLFTTIANYFLYRYAKKFHQSFGG